MAASEPIEVPVPENLVVDQSNAEVRRAVEAILMVAVDPVAPNLLAQLLELPAREVEVLCEEMAELYRREGRGFNLERVAGGYRFQSHPDQAQWVERFVLEGQSRRLTAAALETLAIVAYKQPISRMQVSAIRGVDVDGVLSKLHRAHQQELHHCGIEETACACKTDPAPGVHPKQSEQHRE